MSAHARTRSPSPDTARTTRKDKTMTLTTRPTSDTTRATAALWAGIGYALLFALAIVANFAVVQPVKTAGSAAASVEAIAADPGAFRFAVLAFAAIFVIDVVIAWALHVILRPAGEMRSLLAAWMRLTYTVLLGAGVAFLHLAGQLATGGIEASDGPGLAALLLEAFDITWLVGLIAFGAHLLLIGAILLDARLAPRILAIGLMIAGAAYIADTIAHLVVADYAAIAGVMLVIVAIPSMLSELGLTVWLFVAARRLRAAGRGAEQVAARV
ncbi:DUF4386 domain-containing protein [Microbacter sp. GSS18]|nr:DUF4386 domain-containing protein [Microbacter sp. GSS18]